MSEDGQHNTGESQSDPWSSHGSSGKAKQSWWRIIWPAVENYRESKLVARRYGSALAAFLAYSWGGLDVVHFFFSGPPKDFAFYAVLIFYYLLPTLLFLWLMWRIWNDKLIIVPFIVVWFVIQTIPNHTANPFGISIAMALFASAALRGWWKVRKHDRASH